MTSSVVLAAHLVVVLPLWRLTSVSLRSAQIPVAPFVIQLLFAV
jgi:hypothetical protein